MHSSPANGARTPAPPPLFPALRAAAAAYALHPALRTPPAEPLIGSNSDPPQPYNASSVRSVVRWGTAAGQLAQEAEQEHQLVYEYIYGESESWNAAHAG